MVHFNIPVSEVEWLYELDNEYKTQLKNGHQMVFSINILPPSIKKYVKSENIEISYVNLGPFVKTPEGFLWNIWGWNSLPVTSFKENTDWSSYFVAKN